MKEGKDPQKWGLPGSQEGAGGHLGFPTAPTVRQVCKPSFTRLVSRVQEQTLPCFRMANIWQ